MCICVFIICLCAVIYDDCGLTLCKKIFHNLSLLWFKSITLGKIKIAMKDTRPDFGVD